MGCCKDVLTGGSNGGKIIITIQQSELVVRTTFDETSNSGNKIQICSGILYHYGYIPRLSLGNSFKTNSCTYYECSVDGGVKYIQLCGQDNSVKHCYYTYRDGETWDALNIDYYTEITASKTWKSDAVAGYEIKKIEQQ